MIPFVSIFSCSVFQTRGTDNIILKGGIGLIAALGMKALKLETVTDEV
jgi:hypothetical protein